MIGKEANRIEEVQAGQVQDVDEVLESYSGPSERWNEVVRPILKQIPVRRLSVLTGKGERWLSTVRNRERPPTDSLTAALHSIVKCRLQRGAPPD